MVPQEILGHPVRAAIMTENNYETKQSAFFKDRMYLSKQGFYSQKVIRNIML